MNNSFKGLKTNLQPQFIVSDKGAEEMKQIKRDIQEYSKSMRDTRTSSKEGTLKILTTAANSCKSREEFETKLRAEHPALYQNFRKWRQNNKREEYADYEGLKNVHQDPRNQFSGSRISESFDRSNPQNMEVEEEDENYHNHQNIVLRRENQEIALEQFQPNEYLGEEASHILHDDHFDDSEDYKRHISSCKICSENQPKHDVQVEKLKELIQAKKDMLNDINQEIRLLTTRTQMKAREIDIFGLSMNSQFTFFQQKVEQLEHLQDPDC